MRKWDREGRKTNRIHWLASYFYSRIVNYPRGLGSSQDTGPSMLKLRQFQGTWDELITHLCQQLGLNHCEGLLRDCIEHNLELSQWKARKYLSTSLQWLRITQRHYFSVTAHLTQVAKRPLLYPENALWNKDTGRCWCVYEVSAGKC